MKCNICERGCILQEGKTGACGQYKKEKNKIVELYPNKYLIICPISLETMPILHFYPKGKMLQISTIGCNFDCQGCISTVIVKEMEHSSKAIQYLLPEQIIDKALKNNCKGISFLMNDPLASFYTFLEVAKEAKKHDLFVGCSSNTYFTKESLKEIIPYLDYINVGMKGLCDKIYIECGGKTVEPVLRNIQKLYENGVHIEISCIYKNDNKEEVISIAKKLADISKNIPLQIMRFIPLEGANPSLEPSIKDGENLCRELKEILNYVYLFNSPGTDCLNTYCPKCGQLIYKRDFYGPMGAKLRDVNMKLVKGNICTNCGTNISIKHLPKEESFQEGDFQGGYPFTRALEIVEAILITMGVKEKHKVVEVWEYILCNDKLTKLHHDIQDLDKYVNAVKEFGILIDYEDKANDLANYLKEKLTIIEDGYLKIKTKPSVYYAMGKPLFCIKGTRMENQLVEAAGGININNLVEGEGRPGIMISPQKLNELNPDIIFISAFLSSSVEDFHEECIKEKIEVNAVKNKRIYTHPAPGWDFGSPRWILGLMYMANVLHPEIYNFDILEEAKEFYHRFYQADFNLAELNRSFAKPSSNWKWKKLS